MKIAVIGNGFYPTLVWLKDHLGNPEISTLSVADSRLVLADGREYIIVQSKSDVQGRLFNGYIIAPTYFDLVGFVKSHCEIRQDELPRLPRLELEGVKHGP